MNMKGLLAVTVGAAVGFALIVSGEISPTVLVALVPKDAEVVKLEGSPFSGYALHHYGTVFFEDRPVELKHEFVLRNSSGSTVHVTGTSASCSCTQAAASASEIPPEGELRIATTLRAGSPGTKSESIWVRYGDHELLTLTLRADVRSGIQFFADRTSLDLTGAECAECFLMLRRYDDAAPLPTVMVLDDGGAEVAVGEWKRMWVPAAGDATPVRWMARAQVSRRAGSNLSASRPIRLKLPGGTEVAIATVPAPFL